MRYIVGIGIAFMGLILFAAIFYIGNEKDKLEEKIIVLKFERDSLLNVAITRYPKSLVMQTWQFGYEQGRNFELTIQAEEKLTGTFLSFKEYNRRQKAKFKQDSILINLTLQ